MTLCSVLCLKTLVLGFYCCHVAFKAFHIIRFMLQQIVRVVGVNTFWANWGLLDGRKKPLASINLGHHDKTVLCTR